VSLIPTFFASADRDGLVVNLFDTAAAELELRDGVTVGLKMQATYPEEGRIAILVEPDQSKAFAVKLRIPAWSRSPVLVLNGSPVEAPRGRDGYAAIRRVWKKGDRIGVDFKPEPRLIAGERSNSGKVALCFGPLVLAADESMLSGPISNLSALVVPATNLGGLNLTPERANDVRSFRVQARSRKSDLASEVRLVSFADAGGSGSRYKVWLPLAKRPGGNLLLDGMETRSRAGNLSGSIIDEDKESLVVTFDGARAEEDWFAVSLDAPVEIRSVVFHHGKSFHDGGWFDTSAGKPAVQIQRARDARWETIGELRNYPATTAKDSAKLKPGQSFTLRLAAPASAVAVRIVGKPASGDSPRQAFSSCAEIEAFEEAR
jgi:hypothetical protein